MVKTLLDATRAGRVAAGRRSAPAALRRLRNQVLRLGWGVADQAVSSVTNVAMVLYVAHSVGAAQFGAFSLAYVTYSFVLNASRGLTSDPLMVRFSGADLPTWRRAVANCSGTAAAVGLVAGAVCACGSRAARQHGQVRLPRARADAAGAHAAGQLAFFVLRNRTRRPGIPQRPGLGSGAPPGIDIAAGRSCPKRILVRFCMGRGGGRGCRRGTAAGPSHAEAFRLPGMALTSS